MAWNDNPIVDANSKRCEESENATRNIFTKKRGFQSREEKPDYGVDFVVELIEDNKMSGFQFAIQLKSKENFKQIESNKSFYFSFQFETSRLGYICRRRPGLGLIIIYNETNATLHYDYIEEIVKRLDGEREDGDWRENNKVNIHIPVEQLLDEIAARSIFSKMKTRRDNHQTMYAQNAQKHDLPLTNFDKGFDKEKLYKEFEYMGALLINSGKHDLVYRYLSILERKQVLQSKAILYYALLSAFELGYYIDAQFYLNHCKQRVQMYGEDEKEAFRILEPKIQFLLGNIEFDEFIHKLQQIASTLKFGNYQLNVQMDILVYETSNLDDRNFNDFYAKIQSIVIEISNIKNKEMCYGFKLQIHEVIKNAITKLFSELLIDRKLREECQLNAYTNDIELRKSFIYKLETLNKGISSEVILFATAHKNTLLHAEAVWKQDRFMLETYFYAHLCTFSPTYTVSIDNSYIQAYYGLIWAANVFLKENRFRQAQLSLGSAVELQELFEYIYPNADRSRFHPKLLLLERLQKIETETSMNSYIFTMTSHLKEITNEKKIHLLDDNNINRLAINILKSQNLPNDYLPNIVAEIKSFQIFEKTCKNKNLILMTKPFLHQFQYQYPSIYAVLSRKTNIELASGHDINIVIKNLGKLIYED